MDYLLLFNVEISGVSRDGRTIEKSYTLDRTVHTLGFYPLELSEKIQEEIEKIETGLKHGWDKEYSHLAINLDVSVTIAQVVPLE